MYSIKRLVGLEIGEVALAEPIQHDLTLQLCAQLGAKPAEELALRQPAGLEIEQGIGPPLQAEGDHRAAEFGEGDPGVGFKGSEGTGERGREYAAEIADDRLDLRHVF